MDGDTKGADRQRDKAELCHSNAAFVLGYLQLYVALMPAKNVPVWDNNNDISS